MDFDTHFSIHCSSTKSFKSLEVRLLDEIGFAIIDGDAVMILKRYISLKSQAELKS